MVAAVASGTGLNITIFAGVNQRLAIADDILVNTGELAALPAHVAALDAQYRALSSPL